jgi:hypothetical protein
VIRKDSRKAVQKRRGKYPRGTLYIKFKKKCMFNQIKILLALYVLLAQGYPWYFVVSSITQGCATCAGVLSIIWIDEI